MSTKKLNGSVDTLALAMRQVFTEAVEGAVEPLTEEVKGLRSDMDRRFDEVNKRIDGVEGQIATTNENMAVQFNEQEQKIKKLISERAPAK